jgi:hypothetical protein
MEEVGRSAMRGSTIVAGNGTLEPLSADVDL